MSRKRVAIACQGGGSQCAFVAGALGKLFERGIHQRFNIVALSGTSGGALTAALAWLGMLERAQGSDAAIEARILGLWKDLTAQSTQEIFLDNFCIQLLRLSESGFLPSFASSPASPQFQRWSKLAALMIARPEFTDLGALLAKHIDFEALPSLMKPDSPVLHVGAADVLDGTFKVFSSARGEIRREALLASAAIPTLFPAVWVDGHAYWDGIFSSNPPIASFLQRSLMGDHAMPQEIWVIQVNATRASSVPERPSDITDRRNHMAGNLSLRHELQLIEILNLLIHQKALTDEFRARIRMDTTDPITVRFIRMSEELMLDLDYPSKLSRHPTHISRLVTEGESQADRFIAELDRANPRPKPTAPARSAG